MPKTVIELPRSIELKELKIDTKTNTIEIDHRFLKGQTYSPVCYLKCEGEGGMESQAVIYLSGNTGMYSARNQASEARPKFDLAPDEYNKEPHADDVDEEDDEEEVPVPVKES
jgi:hypothetical protein